MKKEVEKKTSKLAIASFVLGIVGLITILGPFILTLWNTPFPVWLQVPHEIILIFWLGPFFALSAIVSGLIGLVKVYRNPSLKGKVLCVISILLGTIIFITVYYVISHAPGERFI